MQVNIQDEIKKRPDLNSAIHEASRLLGDELGPSAARVRADWTLSQDEERGREVIDLRVSDWTGSVGYRFAPEELSNRGHMTLRLHRLWGDLLQVRSHAQLDEYRWHHLVQGEH